jgi:hypothetical protein
MRRQTPSMVRSLAFRSRIFSFAKDLLQRIEVGAVRWQEDEPCIDGADNPADRAPLGEPRLSITTISPGCSVGTRHLLDIGEEALAIDRRVNDAGRGDAVMPECRKEGHCTPMAVRDLSPEREPASPPAMGTGHVGLCPRLIDEDETGGRTGGP